MMTVIEWIIGPVCAGISGHYNLPSYIKGVYQKIRGRAKKYKEEESFWKDVIGPYFYQKSVRNLVPGQFVELNNFIITEWFPRCPGQYWTREGKRKQQNALKFVEEIQEKFLVLSPKGKTLMVSGGIGTTRLNLHKSDQGDFCVLCATSSGNCDAGIPLVATSPTTKAMVAGARLKTSKKSPARVRHGGPST